MLQEGEIVQVADTILATSQQRLCGRFVWRCSPCLNYLQPFKNVWRLAHCPWPTFATVVTALLLAIFLAVPLAIYLSTRKKASNWVLQVAGIFRPFLHGSFGNFISHHGDWDASSLDSSGHLLHFPHPSKYHYRFYKGLTQVLKKQGRLWDDQVGTTEEFEIPMYAKSSCLGFGQL